MDKKLLTVKDIAERWKKSEKAIRNYIDDGILVPCKGVPGIRFTEQYIAKLEGVELERFSPLEKRRLERELEEVKNRYETIKSVMAIILSESSKVISL